MFGEYQADTKTEDISSEEALRIRNKLQQLNTGAVLPLRVVHEYSTLREVYEAVVPSLVPSVAAKSCALHVRHCCDRVPGSDAPRAILSSDCVTDYGALRWCRLLDQLDDVLTQRVRHGGFVPNVEFFDHRFFNVSSSEAICMDPQQRQLLECAHECSLALQASKELQVGVYCGIYSSEFYSECESGRRGEVSPFVATSGIGSVASGRISFKLDLRGPSITIDTACSSSLVALDAAESCPAAIVSGVNVLLLPRLSFHVAGMTSPLGRCHTLDVRADGYARAEACVSVCVESKEAGWQSTVRQDGRSASLTAPNGNAQRDLLRQNWRDGVPSALELHGTGTGLGDPIESKAVVDLLDHSQTWTAGKACFGHSESAAGALGLLLSVRKHLAIAAVTSCQLRRLNGRVKTRNSRILVQISPRRQQQVASVSSFGYSGTIANARSSLRAPDAVGTMPRRCVFRRVRFRFQHEHPFLAGDPPMLLLSAPARRFLSEHVVRDAVTFPASAYVEVFQAVCGGNRLTSLVFKTPLLHEADDANVHFTVKNGQVAACGHDIIFASAEFERRGRPQRTEIALTPELPRETCVGAFYDKLHALGLQLGPAFRVARRVTYDDTSTCAVFESGRNGMRLKFDPTEIDCAALLGGFHAGITVDDWALRYPVSIERVDLAGGYRTGQWCTTTRISSSAFDAVVYADARVKVALAGFQTMAAGRGRERPVHYTIEWPESELEGTTLDLTVLTRHGEDASTRAGEPVPACRDFVCLDVVTKQTDAEAASCEALVAWLCVHTQVRVAFVTRNSCVASVAPLRPQNGWVWGFSRSLRLEDDRCGAVVDTHSQFPQSFEWKGRWKGLRAQSVEDRESAFSRSVFLVPRLASKYSFGASSRTDIVHLSALFCGADPIDRPAELRSAVDDMCARLIEEQILPLRHAKRTRIADYLLDWSERWMRTREATPRSESCDMTPVRDEVRLLEVCSQEGAMAKILQGDIAATEILFPEGSLEVTRPIYETTHITTLHNRITASFLKSELDARGRASVLEIGAGTGGTAAYTIPVADSAAATYMFTDVSDHFLRQAKQRFALFGNVFYSLLNIDVDPALQGFAKTTFDVIISSNAIHATPSVRRSLLHMHALLTHGGVVLLNELTQVAALWQLTFGLTDGWWLFKDVDEDRRGNDSPLLDRSSWQAILSRCGYVDIEAGGAGDKWSCMQSTIVARRKPVKNREVTGQRALILGGLGGLGLMTARLFNSLSVRVTLASRMQSVPRIHPPDMDAIVCDASDRRDLWITQAKTMADVIVHSAGVPYDAFVHKIDVPRMRQSFCAKTGAATCMVQNAAKLCVSSMWLFSSAAGIVGAQGACVYGAQNSTLDTIAQHLVQRGLPCSSIQWGTTDMGVTKTNRYLEERVNYVTVSVRRARSALLDVLFATGNVVIMEPDNLRTQPPTNAALHVDSRAPDARPVEDNTATATDVQGTLVALVAEYANEPVTMDASIASFGVDSLGGMELKRTVERTFSVNLPLALVASDPTVREICSFLGERPTASSQDGVRKQTLEDMLGQTSVARSITPYPSHVLQDPIVVVLSSPRSGSSLLQLTLNAHGSLYAGQELYLLMFDTMGERRRMMREDFLQGLVNTYVELRGITEAEARAYIDSLGDDCSTRHVYHELQRMCYPRVLVDKTPSNADRIEFMRRACEIFSSVSFVWLVRHPYACVASGVEMKDVVLGLETSNDAEQRNWISCNEAILEFSQSVDVLRVTYEDFVSERREREVRRLCHHLNIASDDANVRAMVSPYESDAVKSFELRAGGVAATDPKMLRHGTITSSQEYRWYSVMPFRPVPGMRALSNTLGYKLHPQLPPELVWLARPKVQGAPAAPMVFVHDFTGDLWGYRHIAKFAKVPVLGIQATERVVQGVSNMEELALRYVRLLEQVQVRPRIIVGYSLGTRIALRMTRIYQKQDYDCPAVFIDGQLHVEPAPPLRFEGRVQEIVAALLSRRQDATRTSVPDLDWLLDVIQSRGDAALEIAAALLPIKDDTAVEPLAADIVYISASGGPNNRNGTLDAAQRAFPYMSVRPVDGTHFDCIDRSAAAISDIIQEWYDKKTMG